MTITRPDPSPGLEELLSRCFAGGTCLLRELRLTPEQAAALARYPARVVPMGEDWYEISFQEAFYHGCN